MTAAPIVVNMWLNRFLSSGTFRDLGLAPYLPEQMHDMKFFSVVVAFVALSGLATMLTSVHNVWTKTEMRPRVKAFGGTIPWFMLMVDAWVIFTYSEWAWQHGGFAVFILAPYLTMINCRQIVCNMARQEDSWFQPQAFLYFAFPLNRLLP